MTGFSELADAFSSGLAQRAGILASSLIAFSGKQSLCGTPLNSEVAYESHFQMESAGFEPVEKDICSLIAPSVNEMANQRHFNSAYQVTIAFLYCFSGAAAYKSMQPENAEQFSYEVHYSLAKSSSGQFGFHCEPRIVFEAIQERCPSFGCRRILNTESYGRNDCLGAVLGHLSTSADRLTRYAFVVGSNSQSLGCATHFVRTISDVNEYIRDCAEEIRL